MLKRRLIPAHLLRQFRDHLIRIAFMRHDLAPEPLVGRLENVIGVCVRHDPGAGLQFLFQLPARPTGVPDEKSDILGEDQFGLNEKLEFFKIAAPPDTISHLHAVLQQIPDIMHIMQRVRLHRAAVKHLRIDGWEIAHELVQAHVNALIEDKSQAAVIVVFAQQDYPPSEVWILHKRLCKKNLSAFYFTIRAHSQGNNKRRIARQNEYTAKKQ